MPNITDTFRLLVITLCCAVAFAARVASSVSSDSVELSPSVQLIGKYDWEVLKDSDTGASWSRCLDMVWRTVKSGSSGVNFVPTHHWLPDESALNGISSFCYIDTIKQSSAETLGADKYSCFPWSKDLVNEYREAMTLCFAEAMRQGLTVYVRPHLDDGNMKGAWRNGLLLQPTMRYGEFSYYDIMLAPLADALRKAVAITTAEETIKPPPGHARPTVYFALQGEMSATIMRFASDWGRLIPGIRQRIAGADGSSAVDVKVGVGLNFNRLDDTTSVSKQFDSSRLSWLAWQVGLEPPAGTRDGVPEIDVEGLRQLFTRQLDFLGISAYAPYNIAGNSFSLNEFENSAFILCNEMLNEYGIDVRGMAAAGKLELQYSEFGIGGGSGYGGGQVAQTPGEVALRPFFGVYGRYTKAKDPWSIPANHAFREAFYYKALEWLADPEIKTHKVSGVFIWSMASWDVLGIYPESTTDQGSYMDPEIVPAVQAYNSAVRAAKDKDMSPNNDENASGNEDPASRDASDADEPADSPPAKSSPAASGRARVVVVGPSGAQQVLPASG